jgi:hypothetical protein
MDVRPERSFLRDLKNMDRRLGCKFNGQNFVVTYDRGYGEPVNVLLIKRDDNGFRQPTGRDLEILKGGDLAQGESMDLRLKKIAYACYEMQEQTKKKHRENIRDWTKDDKNYLMDKIGRITGQGKPRPAYKPISHKPGKRVVATA